MIYRRSFAFIVDYFILWTIIGAVYALMTSLDNWFSQEVSKNIYFILFWFLPFLTILYMASKDFVFVNASIGKKLFDIEVKSAIHKKKVTLSQLIVRNVIVLFLLPIEVCLVLSNQTRIGDSYAKTFVARKVNK